jgi:uncharacterized protein (TIGR02217 family)
MLNAFDDVRLPEDIERGVIGGPEYRTTVNRLVNAREQRNAEWDYPVFSVNIGYGVQKREDLETIYAFFHARLGRARGFRFRNWLDYQVVEQPVGVITGQPLQRQLIRTYDDDVNPQIRLVTRPVASTLRVYKDMVLTTDYTLGAKGVLTFGSDPGLNVLATFDYDLPVRFDTDKLDVQLTTQFAGAVPSIPIIELRE